MNKQNSGFSLKDILFNKEKVQFLAQQFESADKNFDSKGFVRDVMKQLLKLELKERIVYIAETLKCYLDSEYSKAAKQIAQALPPPLDPTKTDDDFGDFIIAPLGEFVVRNGLAKKHQKLSLKTLKMITQRFSMEDSIRAFINTHPENTLAEMAKWSTDKNYHVRRLVSEGTRPRLPWSKKVSIEPAVVIPLLDILHADSTRYVTRSVANHLNDISKIQPKLVLGTLKRWTEQGAQDSEELQWMCKHALRTLVKQGHAPALKFLGFNHNPKIEITDFVLEPSSVKRGQPFEFSFKLSALRKEALLIDFIIDFVKANGKLSPKVQKLKQISLQKGESEIIKKRHRMRADATTYTLYPGTHHVTLQINGKQFDSRSFELV